MVHNIISRIILTLTAIHKKKLYVGADILELTLELKEDVSPAPFSIDNQRAVVYVKT
jgi:hypothetical protein